MPLGLRRHAADPAAGHRVRDEEADGQQHHAGRHAGQRVQQRHQHTQPRDHQARRKKQRRLMDALSRAETHTPGSD
jgi:hypothetical protein